MTQVGSLYDVFQQAKESTREQETQAGKGVKDNDRLGGSRSRERRPSVLSTSSRASSPYDTRGRRRSSTGRGRGQAVTPLSTIPQLYFDEEFHLENPRTFDVVSEKSDIIKQPAKAPGTDGTAANGAIGGEPAQTGRKALATNAVLQEKLSWYMDTVEIHLISSISTASKSFFTALGSLRELHSEAADSVERIQVLRKDLQKIDREMALGGLNIVNLRRRRENIRVLTNAVSQLCDVVESVSRCEQLVDSGDIEQAADGLDEVERLMAGEYTRERRTSEDNEPLDQNRKAIDLRGIKALEGASDDLAQLKSRIGAGYENRFLNELLGDLRRHVDGVPPDTTLQRWGSSFQRQRGQRSGASTTPAYLTFDDQLRSRLLASLTGLARTRYTTTAATSFKTAVLREMKGLIRKQMPSSSDDDVESMVSVSTHRSQQLSQQEKSSILARNLRALDADDSYSMLCRVYTGVSESLRRLSVQVKVLLDIASGLEDRSSGGPKNRSVSPSGGRPRSASQVAQDEILQILDMSSLLGQAVDIAQSQVTKVLKVRTEQISQLAKEDFLKYFTLNRLFADECEAISGRSGTTLKTVVGNQIRDFVVRFGENQRHGLVEVMDSDRWDARDFGDSENTILTKIIDASTKDIESWTDASRIWTSGEEDKISKSKEPENDNAQSSTNGSSKDKVRSAVIDEQRYILSESATAMMRSIEDFQFLMANIPNMIQDIASALLESLKLFNSRSSQLILGAGATRSAGLKNITTKHLALSSQSLSFIIHLVPYIREFVRRHAPSSPLMGEFDKVKRLYQDHQSGIHEKLVDIMSSRSSVHVNAMKKIDWDASTGSAAVNPYMETLTKETATLHRVLSKNLPDMTVLMIMEPVFKSYRDQWTRAYEETAIKTETGKQR